MSSEQPATIPLKYEFQGSLRRTLVDVPPRLGQIRNKLAKSFPDFAHLFKDKSKTLRLTYTDDDGDKLTVTTNDELEAAYRYAHSVNKILRFTVPNFESEQSTQPSVDEPAVKEANPEQLDEVIDPPVHHGVTCDRSGMNPIVGNRYHKRGQNYDLCQAEFDKISDEAERATYEKIVSPVKYPMAVHYGVTCDRSGMNPIVGNRYHKRGQNYDLCQAEFDKISDEAERATYEKIEVPAPFFGYYGCGLQGARGGWNKKLNKHHNKRWKKQKKFWKRQQRIQQKFKNRFGFGHPTVTFVREDSIIDGKELEAGKPFEKTWIMRVNGVVGLPAGTTIGFVSGDALGAKSLIELVNNGAPVTPNSEFPVTVAFNPAEKDVGHRRSFWRLQTPQGVSFGPRIWLDVHVMKQGTTPKPHMKFLCDVTIPAGETVQSGEKIRKTWQVCTNTGWSGLTLRCLDVDGPYVGLFEAVPDVPGGSRADLSVTLTVPQAEGGSKSIQSKWALVNTTTGEQIGDNLWVIYTHGLQSTPASLLNEIVLAVSTMPEEKKTELNNLLHEALTTDNYTPILKALEANGVTLKALQTKE